jgi:hypothetical protein
MLRREYLVAKNNLQIRVKSTKFDCFFLSFNGSCVM